MIAGANATAMCRATQAGASLAVSARPVASLEAFICPIRNRRIGELKVSGVLVLISDPENAGELSHDSLRELFGSTPAEARLAEAMAGGTGLAEAAKSFGVGYETVRTQLKNIFLKTNTNRQSELSGLLSVSSVRLRRGRTSE